VADKICTGWPGYLKIPGCRQQGPAAHGYHTTIQETHAGISPRLSSGSDRREGRQRRPDNGGCTSAGDCTPFELQRPGRSVEARNMIDRCSHGQCHSRFEIHLNKRGTGLAISRLRGRRDPGSGRPGQPIHELPYTGQFDPARRFGNTTGGLNGKGCGDAGLPSVGIDRG
jgi:hypothetical protein